MLAIVFDAVAAFLIQKHLRSLWSQTPLAILAGVISPFLTGILSLFVGIDMGKAALGILATIYIHPIVVLGCLWFFRWKSSKSILNDKQQ